MLTCTLIKRGKFHSFFSNQFPILALMYNILLKVKNILPEIPMVLANDNFWGYTSDLLFKYKVTWLEAAIVQPCWTSMLVCYVEGDEGHLLGEEMQKQQFRTYRGLKMQ